LSKQQKEDRASHGDKDIPDYDFDPDSEGDDDDGNYVDMVITAFKDTRRILGEVTPGSPLWEMIYEIFNIFSGKVGELEDEYGNVKPEDKKDEKARMELLSLPKFTNYFKITPDDDNYLDNFIDRVSVLAEQEFYVDHGIEFDHLISEFHTHGFLLGMAITEKEPTSTLQAQVMMQILQRLRLVEEKDLYNKTVHYKDVNDMDELHDVSNLNLHRINTFALNVYKRLETCWYVDEANK